MKTRYEKLAKRNFKYREMRHELGERNEKADLHLRFKEGDKIRTMSGIAEWVKLPSGELSLKYLD